MNFSDNSDIKFIIATTDDYLRYIKLQKEYYEEVRKKRKLWYVKIYTKEEFEKILIQQNASKLHKFYLVQINDLLIGYFYSKSIKRVIFIDEMYVRESYRLRDVGKSIILFLEREGLAEQLRAICVFVDIKNEEAINFFEKCGFKKERLIEILEKFIYFRKIP